MPWLILLPLVFLTSLLESTVLKEIEFLGIRPDLFLIIAVLSAIRLDLLEASIASCLLGLAKDILSTGPLGFNASFFIGLSLLIGLSRHKIYRDHIFVQLLIVLIASLIHRGGYALILGLTYGSLSPWPFLMNVFLGALYTTALAPGPYWLFKKSIPMHPVRINLSR